MTNEEYRSILMELSGSVPEIPGGKYKGIWLFDIASGKVSIHDSDLTSSRSSKSSSLDLKIIALLKYIVRFFILRIIFKRPVKENTKAYIGYLVDVDDQGVSNHFRMEDVSEYDVFYWYISSANSLKSLVKKRLNNGWVVDARILESYCPNWAFFKNLIKSVFVFYSIPKCHRFYSSYLTVLDVLNKIEVIEILKSEGYESVKYLSEQYVWEDILTSVGQSYFLTEAYCHNLTGPADLKLNNLSCYMTKADKYYIKYAVHQIMLDGITKHVELVGVSRKSLIPICNFEFNRFEISGFAVFGHFSTQSNCLSIDIANELAKNYKVFFKPHPSGVCKGISKNVTITSNIDDLHGLVNICFFPTKMMDYCFENSMPALIFYHNRSDDTAKFLQKLGVSFATYSDIQDEFFLSSIDPDASGLRGMYSK